MLGSMVVASGDWCKEKGWCVGRNMVENVVGSPKMDTRPDLETGEDVKGGSGGASMKKSRGSHRGWSLSETDACMKITFEMVVGVLVG